MKKVFIAYEAHPSWKFPRLLGVFSSHLKAKKCVDEYYALRFDILTESPNHKFNEYSYYYLSFSVN